MATARKSSTIADRPLSAIYEQRPPIRPLMPLAERCDMGHPSHTAWCPTCRERALPMRNGACGFCDTPLGQRRKR